MKKTSLRLAGMAGMAGTLTLGAASTGAIAADLVVDAGKSSVVAVFKQEGVAVDSDFRKFSGKIGYDQAAPTAASAAIDVQTGSWDIGNAAYNAEVAKKEWLDSVGFPVASFHSTAVKLLADGRLAATGTLTLKGRQATITVPITVKTAGGATSFDGSFTLSRKGFGIGSPIWEELVDDVVTLKFHLVAAAH